MKYNRKELFVGIKNVAGKLSQAQVDSVNAIITEIESYPEPVDPVHAAYILATAWHESRLVPIRETFANSDDQAVARLNKAYRRKVGTDKCYWCKAPHYYGRGFVQLTWKHNYEKAERYLGVNLVKYPNKALNKDIAAKILVFGMLEGWFTGKRVTQYKTWYSMRRVVNGTDKAKTIANYASRIHAHLVKERAPVITIEPSKRSVTEVVVGYNDGTYETFVRKQTSQEKKMAVASSTKPIYKSKTVGGITVMLLFTVLPPILKALGYDELATAVTNHDYKTIIMTLAGMFAVYGRAVAREKLKLPRIRFE
jgi:predicted chitinase